MFILIWATLLLSVRDSGASPMREHCHNGFCITLNEGEISAEAGLCVVIPCSFSVNYWFTVQHLVWFKCNPSKQKCGDSDVIFHTNKESKKVQPGFKGRVSLLEPELWRRNCSIAVSDLTESDSGSYQLRVNGFYNGRADGYTFSLKATVSVKGLTQKPTVVIPSLTEGQQATLTCSAPGICSGSAPEITWTWRGRAENDSHITGNITAFKTENLSAVTQRHSSTLTFNSSAEHHDTSVTCKVSFKNNIITEETVTLNVTYVKELMITGSTNVKEGESLNLTCRVDSFPPALISWTVSDKSIKNATETDLHNGTLTVPQNDSESYRQEESGMATVFISNVTVGHSGRYICTAKYMNESLMGKVDVGVIYRRKPVITGSTTVQEGRALNLTCSVDSFPPAHISWTRLGSNTDRRNDLLSDLQSSNALVIHSVTAEHTGQYMCKVQHMDTTLTALADVTVAWLSKTLNSSGCEVQSDVLTCGCVSQGVPLPTIKWPLLRSHPKYSITTTVSNHTVNSTVTLTVKNHSSTAVECVSSNEVGEVKANMSLKTVIKEPQGQLGKVSKTVSWLEVIVAFLIGALLSAVLCYLVTKYHRKRQKKLDETLEMVDNQEDALIDANHAVEDNHTYHQEVAEEAGGAETEEKAKEHRDGVH